MPEGKVHYIEGKPAWVIRVPQPGRFKGVERSLQFRLFYTPQGALIACLLKLYDIPDQPYFIHRVFDISHDSVWEFLTQLTRSGNCALDFESKGNEEGFIEKIPINARALSEMLQHGFAYNTGLKQLNGPESLDRFLEVFEPCAQKYGCEAGWEEVEKHFSPRRDKEKDQDMEATPAQSAYWIAKIKENPKEAAAWTAAFVIVVIAAWFLARGIVWWAAAVLGALSAMGLWTDSYRSEDRLRAGAVSLLWILWLFIGIRYPVAKVFVDNFNPYPVRLELDGKPWATAPRDATLQKNLRRGVHDLVVRSMDGKQELRRMPLEVKGAGPYVLNVLGAMSYYQGTAYYGYGGGSSPGEVITQEWFQPRVQHLFESPPGSVKVSKGTGGATRTYLQRRFTR